MKAPEVIGKFLVGDIAPRVALDEASWYAWWREENLGALAPTIRALTGGLLADRLAWAFVAGHQAAISRVFPEAPKDGWGAFAASEHVDFPSAEISRQSDGAWQLNGAKSWIAQSRSVDFLVVTVKARDAGDDGGRAVLVDRDSPGLSLNHRDRPTFLAALSQGFANFDGVEVDDAQVIDSDRRGAFVRSEPPLVMLAVAAHLLGQLGMLAADLQDELTGLVLALAHFCDCASTDKAVLAALDRSLQRATERFVGAVDCSSLPDWEADRRLISLYSAGIQQRAQ